MFANQQLQSGVAKTTVQLKRGLAVELETWNRAQVDGYVREILDTEENRVHARQLLPGFGLLGVNIYQRESAARSQRFGQTKSLSHLEQQNLPGSFDADYDRAFVALNKGVVRGILYCNWINDGLPFWRYHLRWVDVHSDWRGLGVASALLSALDSAPFIKGKILQLSCFTNEGMRYLERKVPQLLHARDYAAITHLYAVLRPPSQFGWHTDWGERTL